MTLTVTRMNSIDGYVNRKKQKQKSKETAILYSIDEKGEISKRRDKV